jgi:hypothetical protein
MPGKMINPSTTIPTTPGSGSLRSSRLSCGKVGKAQIFTLAREGYPCPYYHSGYYAYAPSWGHCDERSRRAFEKVAGAFDRSAEDERTAISGRSGPRLRTTGGCLAIRSFWGVGWCPKVGNRTKRGALGYNSNR